MQEELHKLREGLKLEYEEKLKENMKEIEEIKNEIERGKEEWILQKEEEIRR